VRRNVILYVFLSVLAFHLPLEAQNGASKDQPSAPKAADSSAASGKSNSVESRVEQYLRNLYAWGPAFDVKVGPTKPSPIADLLEVPVTVSMGGQSDTAVVYVSKTRNYLLRGELTDLSADPFAEVRSKLHVGTSPSMGPEDAKITLIEFADFECPSCRQLDLVLRDFLPRHPEIRLVFKHFPLTDIHPWAMTAAVAAQCAYEQSPAAFWKMHDAIFDAQDVISPSNAWDKMLDLGNQLGLNAEAYGACRTNPDTTAKVKAVTEEGRALNITATPTSFLNGRRVVGPDKSLLEQYITFIQGHHE
jgi:protein-disulfide isomerase